MLGKLIKHEFRITARIIPLFYLAVLASAISTATADFMRLRILSLVSASLLMVSGALITYGTAIYLVMRFYKGVYGPEGYLTMTLPVREDRILLSRGIVSAAWSLLGCACCTATIYYSFSVMIRYTQESAEEISAATEMFSGGLIWFVFIAMSVGILTFLSEAFMCVTIAHVRPFRKLGLGAAVIAYIIMYTAEQLLSLPLVLFVPLSVRYTQGLGWSLSNTNMASSFTEMFAHSTSESPPVIGVTSLFLSVTILIACYVITARLMKKKINLR